MDDLNFIGVASKSFYGNKPKYVPKWLKKKQQQQLQNDLQDDKSKGVDNSSEHDLKNEIPNDNKKKVNDINNKTIKESKHLRISTKDLRHQMSSKHNEDEEDVETEDDLLLSDCNSQEEKCSSPETKSTTIKSASWLLSRSRKSSENTSIDTHKVSSNKSVSVQGESSKVSCDESPVVSTEDSSPLTLDDIVSSPPLHESSMMDTSDTTLENTINLTLDESFTSEKNNSIDDKMSTSSFMSEKNEKLNSSCSSDSKVEVKRSTTQTTPTQKKNSILNYFSKSKSESRKDHVKLETKPKHAAKKRPSSSCQLTLKNEKIYENDNELFNLPVSPRVHVAVKRRKKTPHLLMKKPKKQKKEQTYIDIGQKDFGHVTCPTCGMVYTKSQDEDEAQHAKYHQNLVHKLRFNGWKNERLIEEFPDGRIIAIYQSDSHLHLKKLTEVKDVVDSELGFNTHQDISPDAQQKAFLFISSKKVIGCCIAVEIRKAFPVIPNTNSSSSTSTDNTLSAWCCSSTPVSALCGISRIWVFSQSRRQNIATRLADAARQNFLYGCVIPKKKLAFSDPTPNGRSFAEKYVGVSDVLVFR